MDTPTYNAEGHEVWQPQPGKYWPKGLQFRESYGGIIAVLNDLQVAQGDVPKAYPQNFAGIIAAIADLEKFLREGDLPAVGDLPPTWNEITNDWNTFPVDGSLWFDTRQGRLFIAIDGDFVQTNGGDGISHVGPNPPTIPPVIGQHWLDTDTGLFYVYIGDGLWQAVVSDGDVTVTTASLPLAIARNAYGSTYDPQILPPLPDISQMQVQKDYNTWLMSALVNVDKAITEGSVSISETPPTENVVPGTLWYDSNTLELSIYYKDDDSEQWVPVSVGYAEQALAPFQERLNAEIANRQSAIDSILFTIGQMDAADDADVQELQDLTEQLETRLETLENKPEVDFSPYVQVSALNGLGSRVSALEAAPGPDLSPYAYQSQIVDLQTKIDDLDLLKLSDVTPLIPDVSGKVEQSDIDVSVAAITDNFLPRNGGVVDGHFIVNKSDISAPAFDVSSHWSNSKDFMKLKSWNPTDATATFGATEQYWTYAWQFNEHEDFAWLHGNNKVFSVTEDGPACSALYIGQFSSNTESGRRMLNTIEVGEQLRSHEAKLAAIRSAVSQSTDYDSLKAGLLTALSS